RYVLSRGAESVVVDLVRERVPQLYGEKIEYGTIRVDPAAEIFANKLTALLSRSEARDLVDLFLLERAGHSVETALSAALAKDGGCTPEPLGWVLSQVEIRDDAALPGEVRASELRTYLADLVRRLRKLALP